VAAFAVDIARQLPQPQDDGSLIRGERLQFTEPVGPCDVAFRMLNVFHAVACREHNKQKTVMLAKSSDPCTALKCRSIREVGDMALVHM
jgi:hypothetical protein